MIFSFKTVALLDLDPMNTIESWEVVPKPLFDFDKEDFQKYELNALAIKLLHCGLGPHENNIIMGCKSAKKIWDLLEVTYEGTNEVKRSKIDLLMSKYERFEMLPKETIEEMFTRYNDIINELGSLGKHIPIDEQARKVLRNLPQDERWRSKITALQETKDFTNLALKALETDDSEVDEDEMAMLVSRFKKILGNRKYDRNKKFSSSKETTCFKCGSKEHFIRDCPLKENDRAIFKGKDQESKEEEDEEKPPEETAHLCLMAKTDEKAKLKELEAEVPVRGNNTWYLDNGNSVRFTSNSCRIINNDTGNIILEGTRKGNTYIVDLNEVPNSSLTCLSVIEDDPPLWHKRFGHASFSLLDKLRSKELVEGIHGYSFFDETFDEFFAFVKKE
ncbi:uncharacterized protein LOC110726298 [Chenopodium quinoa]|uniref:uncharacterized protein LOC110726298 n=1 Tax=Chenopodium quinoa TaxID=63459 RepID=UPI000B784780|nr:uncharacterized protein LOC110726298 [Chenopodium quinoa]